MRTVPSPAQTLQFLADETRASNINTGVAVSNPMIDQPGLSIVQVYKNEQKKAEAAAMAATQTEQKPNFLFWGLGAIGLYFLLRK
jgi:hypothetical protein